MSTDPGACAKIGQISTDLLIVLLHTLLSLVDQSNVEHFKLLQCFIHVIKMYIFYSNIL